LVEREGGEGEREREREREGGRRGGGFRVDPSTPPRYKA
jgi:hypothetical protein